jgi:coenzyme F420-dependent glucose-6-phosphate dehydrogenase
VTPSAPTVTLGYHCSHEQHPPSTLLRHARQAEAAGFTAAMCSDHFHPWIERQGHSGYTWSWLGAALQATRLSFGTVTAPGQRYHPAIVAQAAATLAEMYPGRFWVALGSGEALNESMTGLPWPDKEARQQRLRECADVMRALWAGETVTHRGLVRVEHARLYSRPAQPPMLFVAALSPETARRVAPWADGLITVAGPRDDMRRIVDAFRDGGGERAPLALQVPIAYADSDEQSRRIACEHWAQAGLDGRDLADLPDPQAFERAIAHCSPDTILQRVRASADAERQAAWLQEDVAMGFTRIYLHNVNPDQQPFFDGCAQRLLRAVGGR